MYVSVGPAGYHIEIPYIEIRQTEWWAAPVRDSGQIAFKEFTYHIVQIRLNHMKLLIFGSFCPVKTAILHGST